MYYHGCASCGGTFATPFFNSDRLSPPEFRCDGCSLPYREAKWCRECELKYNECECYTIKIEDHLTDPYPCLVAVVLDGEGDEVKEVKLYEKSEVDALIEKGHTLDEIITKFEEECSDHVKRG